jgi:protein-disulfide isomerase/uncharacterized membrane protein
MPAAFSCRGNKLVKRLPTFICFLAFCGFFVSSILVAAHFLDLPVPCGKSRGCVQVATHPSSKMFGIPIAAIGVVAYLSIIVLLLQAASSRWASFALLILAAVGTVISAALLIYAHNVIHATCLWCIASGVVMALLFVCSLLMGWTKTTLIVPKPAVVWGLGFLTAIGIGAEAGAMQKAANAPPLAAEKIVNLRMADLVDPAKSRGGTNAPVTIIMFADFWCTACRHSYGPLIGFQKAHPDKIRVVYRNLPLFEIRGHQFSGTAAALSEIAGERGKFWEFADALHEQKTQLGPDGYLQLMEKLGFDKAEVEKRMKDPNDPAILRANSDKTFAEGLGIHSTPTFILFVAGQQPISANQRTLPKLLNSPTVQSLLSAKQSEGVERGAVKTVDHNSSQR